MDWHRRRRQLRLAAVFLTRLPLRLGEAPPAGELAAAAWAFPLVGIAVGLAGALVYAVAGELGLTPLLAALLAVAAQIVLTGALHEDALADVADGFGGGRSRERKLEIMRDSRIGAFGTLALVFSVALRAAAIAALGPAGAVIGGLAAAGALSRTATVALMAHLPPARPDGLGASAGAVPLPALYAAAFIAALAALVGLGIAAGLATLAAAAAATLAFAALARRQIGGHTGDVLGAGQQIAEAVTLLAAVALAG